MILFPGLPQDFDQEGVKCLYKRIESQGLSNSDISACTLISSGLRTEEAAKTFVTRVKCSNKEKDIILYVMSHREKLMEAAMVGTEKDVLTDIMVDLAYKEKRPRESAIFVAQELAKYCGRTEVISKLEIPHFPIKGGLLVDKVQRKHINKEVRRLMELWKQSGYALTREELLDAVQEEANL